MTNIGRIVLARVPRNVAPKRQLSALVSAVDEFPGYVLSVIDLIVCL